MLDPKYITRAEIVELTGASKSQVYKVTADQSSGFPRVIAYSGWRNEALWCRDDVTKFLADYTWATLQTRRRRTTPVPERIPCSGKQELNLAFKRPTIRVRHSKYTDEYLTAVAFGYKSKISFVKSDKGAYRAAQRRGKVFLTSIRRHMERPESRRKYSVEYLTASALCFKSKKEFEKSNRSAYLSALRRGKDFLNSICKHMETPKRASKYTDEYLAEIARGFKSRISFAKSNRGAYLSALRRGKDFLNSICQHMTRPSPV
jgi:predicted DNA-binding transcriptional regulator AlpA